MATVTGPHPASLVVWVPRMTSAVVAARKARVVVQIAAADRAAGGQGDLRALALVGGIRAAGIGVGAERARVGHAAAVVVLAVRARGRGLAAARDRRDELIGDLGNPRTDVRLIGAILRRDGRAAGWLRTTGVDEAWVREFGG